MPEYLAPGVYVEEVGFRSKSIEGVGTSTAAFVGPAHQGPLGATPVQVTSFTEFERIFGGRENLNFAGGGESVNHLAHATAAFFANGGQQLFVVRTFMPPAGAGAVTADDGSEPPAARLDPQVPGTVSCEEALAALESVDEVAIVAAPGHAGFSRAHVDAVRHLLIAHCERMRYRFAILDTPAGLTPGEVGAVRSGIDTSRAAFYYPWVVVANPAAGAGNKGIPGKIALPPSGFVAGIYARNDIERGVWKAPANEVVHGAIGFERMLNKSQQEILNPLGINCLRFFEGRGYRLWGARTASSDAEWKYVNVRRYFCYLERSIDKGTQWAVFEPNGEALWANIRQTIEDFLRNEWQNGALLGDKPEKAYFVRCDRSTMSQNDLDNERLVCLVGVAPLKPTEFVIFRIGQWTADRKD